MPVPVRLGLGALGAAVVAGGAGLGAGELARALGAATWLSALAAIGAFGVLYLGAMVAARVPEASAFARRLRRR